MDLSSLQGSKSPLAIWAKPFLLTGMTTVSTRVSVSVATVTTFPACVVCPQMTSTPRGWSTRGAMIRLSLPSPWTLHRQCSNWQVIPVQVCCLHNNIIFNILYFFVLFFFHRKINTTNECSSAFRILGCLQIKFSQSPSYWKQKGSGSFRLQGAFPSFFVDASVLINLIWTSSRENRPAPSQKPGLKFRI